MKVQLKLVVGLLSAAAVISAAALAPRALRRMDSFRVRRVEISGTRYLAPHEALRASGITSQSNLFDDYAPWEKALNSMALVNSARIERRLPSTLVITIAEADPVALQAGAEGRHDGLLAVINAAGEVLPLDPTRFDLDLPVIIAAGSPAQGPSPALRALLRVREHEPAMYGWISDAEAVPGGVRLRLRSPAGAAALVSNDPDPVSLRELRTTLADLAARQDINRLIRIDARYRDQIVVALSPMAAL